MEVEKHKNLIFNYLYLFSLAFLAASIYFLFRDKTILFNQFFSTFGFDGLQEKQRIQEIIPVPNWIIYSLPGGIWVYVASIFAHKFEKKLFYFPVHVYILPAIYALGLEFCQLCHLTDGTFDWLDLLFVLIGVYLAKHSKHLELNLSGHPKIQHFALISAFLVLFLSNVYH